MENHSMSREQFRTYLLLYAANADMQEKESETQYIRELARCDNFDEIHAFFIKNSDYESIQLILSYRDRFFPTVKDQESLLQEVAGLFQKDGKYNLLEENAMRMIKKLIH